MSLEGELDTIQHKKESIVYECLPNFMQSDMRFWIEKGNIPSGFLTAVLCNNLMEAFARADNTNALRMHDYAKFLHNEAPRGCFGSQASLQEWAKAGGLNGMIAKLDEEIAKG